MGCNVEACAECIQKCLLTHGKNKNSPPVVTSFFKVMIGDQFSKILFLPPKFARTVSSLIDQSTFLQDSSGQQWKVKLSDVNGSLAFQTGWNSFSVDHGLKVGDFLVFKYIIGSHFFVEIYNRTGCEKLEFSEKRKQKKRGRTCSNSTAEDGPSQPIDKSSMNKQGSSVSVVSGSYEKISQSQSKMTDGEQIKIVTENMSNYDDSNGGPQPVSEARYIEEPYYMINRDLGKVEDRSTIFDLSNFEMWKNKSGTDGSDKVTAGEERFPLHADTTVRSQVEAGRNVDPIAEDVVTRVLPSDASEIEMEKNNDTEEMNKIVTVSDKDSCNSKIPGHLLTASSVKPGKDGENSSDMSSRVRCKIAQASLSENGQVVVSQIEISQSAQLKITGMSESPDDPVALSIQNCQSAEMGKIVKQEPVEMDSEFCSHREIIQEIHEEYPKVIKEDFDEVHASVKIETIDLASMSSPIAANIICLIAMGSQSFLELPTCLPCSYKGRVKMERKVVLLQDSKMRLWPVLYHERSGFKMLTSGWEAFSKANNIQPGDECVLGIESETDGIYGVHIVQKK